MPVNPVGQRAPGKGRDIIDGRNEGKIISDSCDRLRYNTADFNFNCVCSGAQLSQIHPLIRPDTDAEKPTHSLYAGGGYGSNMVYLGTTLSEDQGFGYMSLSYGLMDKLYLSATGYTVIGFSPVLAYYSIGLSFNHTFNSWFDISTGISRYNVAESLKDTLFNSFTYADATLGVDWRILYSKISLGGLWYGESQFYLQTQAFEIL